MIISSSGTKKAIIFNAVTQSAQFNNYIYPNIVLDFQLILSMQVQISKIGVPKFYLKFKFEFERIYECT